MKNIVNEMKSGTKIIADMSVKDLNGIATIVPYYIIKGKESGPTICITSGVHGTEYPGIAANLKLFKDIDPNKFKGTIIGCPMCNFEAFSKRSMFVNPLDNKNLNDVFPGNKDGTITEVIADTLLNRFVAISDFHIDMHSGDSIEYLYPYAFYHVSSKEDKFVDDKSFEMAKAYGLDFVAPTQLEGKGASDKGNFYASVSEMGIPSIQPEVGGLGLMTKETRDIHYNGVKNVLILLGMIKGETGENKSQLQIKNFYRLKANNDGIFNCFVSPGENIEKNQLIGTIADYHNQNIYTEFRAESNGVVLWTMASLAAKTGDKLMAIGSF